MVIVHINPSTLKTLDRQTRKLYQQTLFLLRFKTLKNEYLLFFVLLKNIFKTFIGNLLICLALWKINLLMHATLNNEIKIIFSIFVIGFVFYLLRRLRSSARTSVLQLRKKCQKLTRPSKHVFFTFTFHNTLKTKIE